MESAPNEAMLKVLIVDDEPAALTGLARLLGGLDYAVRTATDGEMALRMHRDAPAHIVLTDWSMPGVTGLDVCAALKDDATPPYVILMTALDGQSRLAEALRAGADEFVRKPIDFDELEARLLVASRLVRALLRLAEQNVRLLRNSERFFVEARVDPLTQVGNRIALTEALARTTSDVTRYSRRASLAMCDIDHFKQLNDRDGHLAGDLALHKVAAAIHRALRSSDSVFRYGGDEFVALLPEQSLADAVIAMERVRAVVKALAIPLEASPTGHLTISVGVAEHGDDGVAHADAALYKAKLDGRDCVRGP
jgi:diguanylate cyclase (GGDEF)-like protein